MGRAEVPAGSSGGEGEEECVAGHEKSIGTIAAVEVVRISDGTHHIERRHDAQRVPNPASAQQSLPARAGREA